jgi:MFS family permease
MPELMEKFSIGATEFGDFAGTYYIGYILMQIPFGILLSRFGAKAVMPISIVITALGSLPIAAGAHWHLAILGRFMIGIGSSAAIVGAFQIFRNIFPEHFTRVLGALVCVGLLTAVYISQPLSIMIHSVGIEKTVHLLVVGGMILAVVTYFVLPKMPLSKTENIWIDIKQIFSNKKVLLISFLAGLMVAPLEGFADAWGTAFIRVVYDIERSSANAIVSAILTGMCIGSILLPYIAEKVKSYYGTTMTSGIIMAICFSILLTGWGDVNSLYIISLVIGICSAYQIVIISHISTYVKLSLSGMAAAISNMIVMSFGYVFHKLIAYIVERNANVKIIDSVTTYGYNDYICGVAVIPAAILIAIIGFAWVILLKNKTKSHE